MWRNRVGWPAMTVWMLVAWVSAPLAVDGVTHDPYQCDAGECLEQNTPLAGGVDCGTTPDTACYPKENRKVTCADGVPDVGDPTEPFTAVESFPCSAAHAACADAAGGCWVGQLDPDDVSGEHVAVDFEDAMDVYVFDLPAGTYEFTLAQPNAPVDYAMCLYTPAGGPRTDPVVNEPLPDVEDVTTAELGIGSIETVSGFHDQAGVWVLVIVLASEGCPDASPASSGPQDGPDAIETALGAVAEAFPGTASACLPHCKVWDILSYCFGLKLI